jgi:hypothetical protein
VKQSATGRAAERGMVDFAPIRANSRHFKEGAKKNTGKTREKGPKNGRKWRFLWGSKAPFRRPSSCERSLQLVPDQ